jgi:phosphoserine aminotransferase
MYDVLDRYPTFIPKVSKPFRSRINVTWECATPELSEKCIQEGILNGLYEFKGHRTVGGFRASLFNPISDEAVEKLT